MERKGRVAGWERRAGLVDMGQVVALQRCFVEITHAVKVGAETTHVDLHTRRDELGDGKAEEEGADDGVRVAGDAAPERYAVSKQHTQRQDYAEDEQENYGTRCILLLYVLVVQFQVQDDIIICAVWANEYLVRDGALENVGVRTRKRNNCK